MDRLPAAPGSYKIPCLLQIIVAQMTWGRAGEEQQRHSPGHVPTCNLPGVLAHRPRLSFVGNPATRRIGNQAH